MTPRQVRARLHVGIIAMILTVALVVVGGLSFVGLLMAIFAPTIEVRAIGLLPLAMGLGIGYLMSGTNLWVELDGDLIRQRRMLTGKRVETPIAEIEAVIPLVSAVVGMAGAIGDALFRNPNRGFLIRFVGGRKVGLVRGDMVGIDDVLAALRDRLGPRWAEVIG